MVEAAESARILRAGSAIGCGWRQSAVRPVPAAGEWLLGWGGDAVATFFFLFLVFGVGFIFDPLHADEERDLRLWLVKRNRTLFNQIQNGTMPLFYSSNLGSIPRSYLFWGICRERGSE
jgi:hypothetical protein